MTASTFFGFIVGAGIGWFIAQILLLFFSDEIFGGIDWLRCRVRKVFGLDA